VSRQESVTLTARKAMQYDYKQTNKQPEKSDVSLLEDSDTDSNLVSKLIDSANSPLYMKYERARYGGETLLRREESR
jgi:hypothetical protein